MVRTSSESGLCARAVPQWPEVLSKLLLRPYSPMPGTSATEVGGTSVYYVGWDLGAENRVHISCTYVRNGGVLREGCKAPSGAAFY